MSEERAHSVLRSSAQLVVVEAPAGCGKTHQGAEYAKEVASGDSPLHPLVLTHTHAARSVFAERARRAKSRVAVRTIDSLIGEVAGAYHVGLKLPADIPAWIRTREDGYAELAATVAALVERYPMIAAAVAQRHRVLVCDEHQDSSSDQHRIVMAVHRQGAALRVFADPMQRIFDDSPLDWDVLSKQTSELAELDTPHRWRDGCLELGRWTLRARRTLRSGGAIDLRSGRRPRSVEVAFAENHAHANLAYQLRPKERRPIDGFESRCSSLLVLTRHNATAKSLRSFFNRRILLWEGHTRYALDRLVDAIGEANGDSAKLAAAVVQFLGEVGKGFSPSAFGRAFEREVEDRCSATRRGKPEKIQNVARLLLDDPSHRGVAASLRYLAELASTDAGFAGCEIDGKSEFWEAVQLGGFQEMGDGLAEITHRRNYTRSGPPEKAISTVHKAKGLECDSAVLLPCNAATFPDNEISRCLLYVAISRAKHRLMLVISRRNPSPLLIT